MEFPFLISKALSLDEDGIAILDSATMFSKKGYKSTPSYLSGSTKVDPLQESLASILDKMGEASSKAQGLKSIITNYSRFITSMDNRIYIKADGKKVQGMIKVGKRNLFYHDSYGKVREIQPLCVLDFYVHESVQRLGIGKELFEKMLEVENITPEKLAYDRPSEKLIGFLRKHYGLVNYLKQNNNFVIFNQYWEESKPRTKQQNTKEANSIRSQDVDTLKAVQKKPDPRGQSQTDFSSIGKKILEGDSYHIRANTYADVQEDQKEPITYSGTPMGMGSAINHRAFSYENLKKNQPTSTIGNPNPNSYKYSATTSNPTMPSKDIKSKREEAGLLDIQNKLKTTEDQIAKVQEKISQLSQGKDSYNYNPPSNFKDRGSSGMAPWANFGVSYFNNTSSQAYGKHYNPGFHYPNK